MTTNFKNNQYGYKLYSDFDITDEIVSTNFGDVVLYKPGNYKIYADRDIFLHHNIVDGLMHINIITLRDDININIIAKSEIFNIKSDLYHKVIINNKNVKVNILVRSVINNSKLIYRSVIENNNNYKGVGAENSEFILMDNNSELYIEPATTSMGKDFILNHSTSTHYIKNINLEHIMSNSIDKGEAIKIYTEAFLEKKNADTH